MVNIICLALVWISLAYIGYVSLSLFFTILNGIYNRIKKVDLNMKNTNLEREFNETKDVILKKLEQHKIPIYIVLSLLWILDMYLSFDRIVVLF